MTELSDNVTPNPSFRFHTQADAEFGRAWRLDDNFLKSQLCAEPVLSRALALVRPDRY